jgi:DNA repair exonuclease SbcCD ATPase subunit
MIFDNIRYKNILSTGNAWTTIKLSESITTIITGDNGAGKSTMLDALCFVLFSKPFRKINKPQLINSVNGKNLLVEVNFSVGSHKYMVRRGMKPAVFEIFKNNKLLNQDAAAKDYQEYLEKNILNLSYTSFTQIVILGSSTFIPFMQLATHQRRDIIENLLDIKIFSSMNVILKERISENKIKTNDNKTKIDFEKAKIELHNNYMADIKNSYLDIKKRIKNNMKKSIKNTEHLDEKIVLSKQQINALKIQLEDEPGVLAKLKEISIIEAKLDDNITKLNKDIKFYKNNNICPSCDQNIDENHRHSTIIDKEKKIDDAKAAIDKVADELIQLGLRISEFKKIHEEIKKEEFVYNDLVAQKTSIKHYLVKLKDELKDLSDTKKEDNIDDLKLKDIEGNITTLELEKEALINQKQLLDIAYELLRDNGIKTLIVKQYIPVMNKLINKYLASMEFFVDFELNENFEEIIKSRYRDTFSYASFSEGEKMKIDLALLLTWRAVSKMKNSMNTNLLILDEVFDSSLDASGADEFMKLLSELKSDNNIFVISHKGDMLQDKFDAAIRFEKKKNFSIMV